MAISYQTLLLNQEFIPELFSDERWKGLSIDDKKEIIYSIFHIKNWKQLNPEYRIYMLQELENINASMQDRESYKVVIKDDEKDTSSVQLGPHNSKEIWINEKYLLDEIRYIIMIEKDGFREVSEKINNANVQLFCSICHEGEHAKQGEYIKKGVNTKETNECLLNSMVNPNDDSQINRIYPSQDPVFYKLQPTEYYAYDNSERMTREVFGMLQVKFGIDEGYNEWNAFTRKSDFSALAKDWSKKHNDGERFEYTVLGIRKMIIDLILIHNVEKWYGIDSYQIYENLNLNWRDYKPKLRDDIKDIDENDKKSLQ